MGNEDFKRGALQILRDTGGPAPTLMVYSLQDQEAAPRPGLYPYQSHIRSLLSTMRQKPCNILVSSPTGSGKTFAIEEASELVLGSGSGHLYVAEPLIALAEQVFKRLTREANSRICLRTGPSRQGGSDEVLVTVCTYEALARRFLSNPDLDSSCVVVVDEIHYIASERGPVIQEILTSCSRTPLIGLSGTLPNHWDFARFMASVNGLPTFIVGAKERPVPLSFYVYEPSRVRELHTARAPPPVDPEAIGGIGGKQELLECLRVLARVDSMPLLVILFSCRKLDQFAGWATCNNYLTAQERSYVTVAFAEMLRDIPKEDHALFHDLRLGALQGVARHHSHLPVPYLELVCRLAEARLVKVVFSSSTLSAGINLPVRTVLICGAKMPQRDSTGQMSFDVLSPLLFQQLAGRAGRPGLEAQGYCVIAVRGEKGHSSAQGLVMRTLPPVLPHDELTQGDVLRARLLNSSIGYNRALFSKPALRHAVLLAQKSRRSFETLCARHASPEHVADAMCAARAISTVLASASCLPYAQEKGPAKTLWKDAEGIWHSTSPSAAAAESIALRKTAPRGLAIPLQVLEEVMAVRLALRTLAAVDEEVLFTASIELCVHAREQVPLEDPLVAEERLLLAQVPAPYLERAALTDLGCAACAIRSVPSPCLVMDLLLSAGALAARDLVGILSLALGEGRTGDDSAVRGAFIVELLARFPLLQSFPCLSEASLTQSALRWADGESLAVCIAEEGCSVGVLCRHLVRIHDILEEVAQAFEALQVSDMPRVCRDAASGICRGLPFLKRGARSES